MFRRRSTRSPIGVEITPSTLRLIQLAWQGDDGRVAACAEVPRPAGAAGDGGAGAPDLAELTRRALRENDFHGRRAVANLPLEHTILRHVKVEAQAGQALTDALLFELENAFPGDTPVVQHLEVGEVVERGERRHELILLAAALSRVNEVITLLEQVGLEPVAIDAEGCALIRSFLRRRRRKADAETHSAIVHVGEAGTLMAIAAGDRALFMKQLPVGAAGLLETVARRLDLGAEDLRYAARAEEGAEDLAPQIVSALRIPLDSLALELSACLRYHAASRRSPGGVELILCGAGAEIPGVAQALSESLDMIIQRPDPFMPAFAAVEANERLGREYAIWGVPLGLALREAS